MKKPRRRRLARMSCGLFAITCLAVTANGQSTWLDVSPLRSPTARFDHVMAYDANRGVVVLFGGHDFTNVFSDTWEWNGYFWKQKLSNTRPPARYGAAMVYDEARKKIMLFGGNNGSQSLDDTWEWDGFAWTRQAPAGSPPKRHDHAMCYDSDRSVVVLFGGYERNQREMFDTWEWDGSSWTDMKLAAAASPPRRDSHAMAYDATRKRSVVISGDVPNSLAQTWLWNGSDWTSTGQIMRRLNTTAAFDSQRELLIAFGGGPTGTGGQNNLIWEWNGGFWSIVHAKGAPAERTWHAMAYDSKRRRMVVFGGYSDGLPLADTWELVHDCVLVGEGHSGGGLPINCLSSPLVGSNFRLTFDAVGSGSLYVGTAPVVTPWLQVPPPLVCRPGTMWAAPLASIPGFGTPIIMNFAIPNDPRLIGTRVTLQGAAPQVVGCFLLTDAIEVEIRNRAP